MNMKIKRVQIWKFLLGFVLVIFSLLYIIDELGFNNFAPGAQSSERWGYPVHDIAFFLLFMVFGVILILGSFLRSSSELTNGKNVLICPVCKRVLKKGNQRIEFCPNCSEKLENIDGILERYPDLFKGKNS